jgi:hypothetical protein
MSTPIDLARVSVHDIELAAVRKERDALAQQLYRLHVYLNQEPRWATVVPIDVIRSILERRT